MTIRRSMAVIAFVALLFSIPSCAVSLWQALQDTSGYAPGYSEHAFQMIREGMNERDVVRLLGRPLFERADQRDLVYWWYGVPGLNVDTVTSDADCTYVRADATGRINDARGSYLGAGRNDLIGLSLGEVRKRYGEPLTIRYHQKWRYLAYSKSETHDSYHIRKVWLDTSGKVIQIQAEWYQD
jgi:hypothetical protein